MNRGVLRASALWACVAGVLVCAAGRISQADSDETGDPALQTMKWRCIGPSRGGRVQSVAGIPGDANTYYMGATGGGVWKTTDAGVSWHNVTDGQIGTGSVGAVAVAPSDPNVVYVGMGEADARGNFSHGDGVYKSLDAGRTWVHLGLEDSRQIGRIVIHPRNPDVVYVAALGHIFGPNAQRGVFRSNDGGESWERVLYVSDKAGAVDISMDPLNPRVLYAAFWQVKRTPWGLESGGEGSGLWRSRDGGDTWEQLTKGLPEGIKGKIGVSASRAQRNLVYAIVEAEKGGVFRSTDGGDTWRKTSSDPNLRQRAWYYTHIYADTQEPDIVYVMNVFFMKSKDGGKTFRPMRVPHGDNHDLWIAPDNHLRMINGNDGGANVSLSGGRTWTRQDNQPTAQFYHVITDDSFPYRVYGSQQDNSTVSISSQNRLGGRDEFYSVGGGESGYIAPKPGNPDIVFGGSYGGFMTRYDHATRKSRSVMVWPENPMGWGADELEYRFQWTFPIIISPHDPETIYVGGNVLFKSTDEGQTWEAISGDLTTNDKTKQVSSGGPITKDNTSVEYYCTIFTVAESPLEKGLIWVGSDDGLVHVSSDGGESWTDVTPKNMGDWPMISLIEASPHDADTAYLAVNRYKMDDFSPYIYKTTDRGQTWELIVDGIDDHAFVRAVREDPKKKGLLFAGTETGVWCSLDDGGHWRSLQLKLPVVPITDLVVKDDDVVLATQGRSFWILDDLTPLRQMTDDIRKEELYVLTSPPAYRESWDRVRIQYWLKEVPEEPIIITIRDANGEKIREFNSAKPEKAEPNFFAQFFGFDVSAPKVTRDEGLNLFRWNMRYEAPEKVKGAVFWGPNPRGPRVAPGTYVAQVCIGERIHKNVPFEIKADPRSTTTLEQFAEQEQFLLGIRDTVDEAHHAINTVRSVRAQIDATMKRASEAKADEPLKDSAKAIKDKLEAIEEALIQTRSKSPQDPLNYPIKVNNKLSNLQSLSDNDFQPTAQALKVNDMLSQRVHEQVEALDALITQEVAAFNALVAVQAIPAVVISNDDEEASTETSEDDDG